MRLFTHRAYSTSTHATAINVRSLEAEELRDEARELRIDAKRAGTPPELAASLLQEADKLLSQARQREQWSLGNHRTSKW